MDRSLEAGRDCLSLRAPAQQWGWAGKERPPTGHKLFWGQSWLRVSALTDFSGAVEGCVRVREGGQKRPCSGQGPRTSVRSFWSSHGFLHQTLIYCSWSSPAPLHVYTNFPHLTGLHTPLPSQGACKVFLPPSAHTPSPLTEGMQARKNLGAPVPIQADAAHQELLVHGLDLWARAVLPLCHGVHRCLLPLTPACVWRDGQHQVKSVLPPLPDPTQMPCRELAPVLPCQGQDRQWSGRSRASRWAE